MSNDSAPRKRTSEWEPASPTSPRTAAVNEASPIISHGHSTAKDYKSISPSIPAQRKPSDSPAPGSTTDAHQNGTTAESQIAGDRRQSAEREAAAEERRDQGRWRQFWDKYGSIELENKGSVARDHLALGMFFFCKPTTRIPHVYLFVCRARTFWP